MNQDDEHWVDLMRGEPVPDATARTRAEADRLRATIGESQAEQASLAGDVDPAAAWTSLEARARAEGLTSGGDAAVTRAATRPRKGRFWGMLSALALATATMLAVFGPPMLTGTRGGAERLPPIAVASPAGTAQSIADDLRALGIPVKIEAPLDAPGTARVVVELREKVQAGDPVDQVMERYNVPSTESLSFTIQLEKK
jgi:hypothetical protein